MCGGSCCLVLELLAEERQVSIDKACIWSVDYVVSLSWISEAQGHNIVLLLNHNGKLSFLWKRLLSGNSRKEVNLLLEFRKTESHLYSGYLGAIPFTAFYKVGYPNGQPQLRRQCQAMFKPRGKGAARAMCIDKKDRQPHATPHKCTARRAHAGYIISC